MTTSIPEEFRKFDLPDDLFEEKLGEFVSELQNIAVDYFTSVDKRPFNIDWNNPKIPQEIAHEMPTQPQSLEHLKDFLKQLIPYFPSTGSKSFLGYVPSDPLPEGSAMASITPLFNQFAGSVQGSPGGTAVEALVIKWIAELLGLPNSSFGSFTSGGSMANLTAIYTGLVNQLMNFGIDLKETGLIQKRRPLIYLSNQTHNAIDKAIMMLGLGKQSIRIVDSNENFVMTADQVEKAIIQDLEKYGDEVLPIMIVGTAGTTNTGSIDDLSGLRSLASRYNMWFHIDGAYGAFSKVADHDVARELNGITNCDSIALDCHKWLYTPFEAGLTLVRDHELLRHAFELSAEYLVDSDFDETRPLQRNFRSYGFPLTRELRGLKVWAVISRLGKQGIRNAITRDILKADYLRELISDHPKFELIPHGRLSVVCFVYKGSESNNTQVLNLIQERRNFYLSSTRLNGKTVLRTCFINRRSNLKTVDSFMQELDEVLNQLNLQ